MHMSTNQIAVAAEYLRPMKTLTKLAISVRDRDTIMTAADELAERYPGAVHVGFGGMVSRGRLADVMPDEYIDDTVPQTIIAEIYHSSGAYMHFIKAVFADEAIHENTVVILIGSPSQPLPHWMVNRCVNFQYSALDTIGA